MIRASQNDMPRPKVIKQSEFPYHVTGRSINREYFQIPIEDVWKIFARQLTFITWAYDVKIHAFVLMNNHFHLIISTPKENLPEVMQNFMSETSRYINESAGRINQTYGARHFRGIIRNYHYFLHAYKYVYLNPVVAGLSDRCENYRFSSLNFLLGGGRADFPIAEDNVLFPHVERTLQWLNTRPHQQDWDAVKWAMAQSQFRLARDRNSKKENHLEFDML